MFEPTQKQGHTKTVCVRLTEQEREAVESLMKKYGLTQSDLLRMALGVLVEQEGGDDA